MTAEVIKKLSSGWTIRMDEILEFLKALDVALIASTELNGNRRQCLWIRRPAGCLPIKDPFRYQ